MVAHDVVLPDGRALRAYASDPDDGDGARPGPTSTTGSGPRVILWHHGSPQTGALLPPLLDAAHAVGARLVSYARPGYGPSTERPGRDVASAAGEVEAVLDELGVDRCVVAGHSGGVPHALAAAAGLPDRVDAVVGLAGIAPWDGSRGWFAGMASDAALRAGARGRDARRAHAATAEFDETSFTAADWATLEGPWGALGADAEAAGGEQAVGLVDDDVAFARPWGFALADVGCPVLLVQGTADRVVPPHHAERLAGELPEVEVWRRDGDGHISVLAALPEALGWATGRRA